MRQGPEPTAIERWLARVLGDDLPRHPGSGWISGVVGVFLGAIALGAVVVLHFPDLLTSADLRASDPLPVMRALIQLTIGIAFLSSCLNLLLRPRKTLGLAGLVQYWVHRAFHRLPWLWRSHAIHHSIRDMDWLAGSRLHLGEVVVTRALVVLPAFVLGFAAQLVYPLRRS